MNKFSLILLMVFSIFIVQCTPKLTDATKKMEDKTKDAKDVVVTEVKKKTFRSAAPAAGPAPQIEIGSSEEFKLSNGLQVIVVENHKLPRVSFQLSIDTPPIAEGKKAGAASIAGQLLATGTSTKSKSEIDETVDFMGASLNTWDSGIFGAALTKHKEALLEIMSDVLRNPSFQQAEFDKIKKQTLSSLAQAKEDPNTIATNVSDVLCYGKDHPYGEIETEETINNISIDDIKSYYKNYFDPSKSFLIIVGDITTAEAKPLAEKYFANWTSKAKMPNNKFTKPTAPSKTEVDFVDKVAAVQSVISITYPIVLKPGSDDAMKARVMNTLLGGRGFFKSRLQSNIREDKAYSYGVSSTLASDREIGYFTAGGSVRNEVTDSALVEFMKEINIMRTEEISDADLQIVKSVISGGFARGLESPQTVARFALNKKLYDLPDDYYETYLMKIEAITKADVLAAAKKYLKPENAHIVVVGNKSSVADKLLPFSASNEIKFFDAFGNPIKDADTAVPADMTAEKVIEDYLAAIGGTEKLKAVKEIKLIQGMEIQGMKIMNTTYMKVPGKLYQEQSMNGNVMAKTVFDGTKGSMTQQGQTQAIPEAMIGTIKAQSTMFPELAFKDNGTILQLEGIEKVGATNAYKITVTGADGTASTSYFDVKTSYKIKTITSVMNMTQTTELSDYKEVNGVMFPYSAKISGLAPMTLEAKTETLEINGGIDDAKFKVE